MFILPSICILELQEFRWRVAHCKQAAGKGMMHIMCIMRGRENLWLLELENIVSNNQHPKMFSLKFGWMALKGFLLLRTKPRQLLRALVADLDHWGVLCYIAFFQSVPTVPMAWSAGKLATVRLASVTESLGSVWSSHFFNCLLQSLQIDEK